MRRREFITALGSVAIAWPLTGRAQQRAMPVIGFISAGSPEAYPQALAAFRKALSDIGFVEGQSLAIEYRWAGTEYERFIDIPASTHSRGSPSSPQGSRADKVRAG